MDPIRRVLLGPGRLPEGLRSALAGEGLLFLEEGLAGSVTYRNFRAPGEHAKWRKEVVAGAIALTGRRRLVVWAGRFKHIDVPLDHPLWATIEVSSPRPDRLRFAYDADVTGAPRSGRVEVSLRTPQAAQVLQFIGAAG